MATQWFARNIVGNISSYKRAELLRGTASQNLTPATTAGGTSISAGFFHTPALEAFTLAVTITVRVRARESATSVNAGIRVRVYKYSKTGGLSGVLATLTAATELGTSAAAVNLTGTPTSTAFAAGDQLVFEIVVTNVGGTMAAGTVTISYDGPTNNAAGDTYFQITETVSARRNPRMS